MSQVADSSGPDAIGAALLAVQDGAARLATQFPYPPSRLLVRVGDVAVELEWGGLNANGQGGRTAPTPPGGPVGPAQEQTSPADYVRSPTVGVFYRAPTPGAEPFVREGGEIRPGQQVAIVEAMKLMIPVEAQVGGSVAEILKADGDPVEFDEPVFAVYAGAAASLNTAEDGSP